MPITPPREDKGEGRSLPDRSSPQVCLSVQRPEVPRCWADTYCWVTVRVCVLLPGKAVSPHSLQEDPSTLTSKPQEPAPLRRRGKGVPDPQWAGLSPTRSLCPRPCLPLSPWSMARGPLTTVPTCSLDQDQREWVRPGPTAPGPPQQTAMHPEPRPALQPQQRAAPPAAAPTLPPGGHGHGPPLPGLLPPP